MDRACLLDLDPDLADAVTPDHLGPVRRLLTVATIQVPTGRWEPEQLARRVTPGLGMLVIDGLALRRVDLDHRASAELLGEGDLLRPWQDDEVGADAPFTASWRVLEPLRLAILDSRVGNALAQAPELVEHLLGREVTRARRSVERAAVAQLVHAEQRLLVELWRLADRWGRVHSDGVHLELPLTHEVLGLLTGTRRPSVTAALGRLSRSGAVEPLPGRGWILRSRETEGVVLAA